MVSGEERSMQLRRILLIFSILCIVALVAVPAEANIFDDISNFFSGLLGGPTIRIPLPEDMDYINISPDVLSSPSGTFNVSWNFTTLDNSQFPDCYIRIYGPMHECIQIGSTCRVLSFKIPNFRTVNKTGTRQIAYTGLPANYYGFINLQCEVLGGLSNLTDPFGSVNRDIVPFWTTARNTTVVQDYYSCKSMPGVTDCKEWQRLAARGRTWNVTWGNEIAA
jgi:hypothetical protein